MIQDTNLDRWVPSNPKLSLEQSVLAVIEQAPFGIPITRIAERLHIPFNDPALREALWTLCNNPPYRVTKLGARYGIRGGSSC